MYHLFVSGSDESWNGSPWEVLESRCLNAGEFTDASLAATISLLDPAAKAALTAYTCIFAFETGCKLDARLGRITRIRRRDSMVRVEYEFDPDYPPIKHDHLIALKWELDIGDYELHRTHWALKNEELSAALESVGYPPIGASLLEIVDIHSHTFDIALSFPGEVRNYVQHVASNLVARLGKGHVFYDNYYKAQLARPNLDTALQSLYRDRARLIVAFLSKDFAAKKWCHIEFMAIREILNARADDRVMFIRHDDAEIAGVFSTDGYIDANVHDPTEVSDMVIERLQLIK